MTGVEFEEGEDVDEGGDGVDAVVGVEGDGEGVEDPVGQVPTVVHWPSLPHLKYRVKLSSTSLECVFLLCRA